MNANCLMKLFRSPSKPRWYCGVILGCTEGLTTASAARFMPTLNATGLRRVTALSVTIGSLAAIYGCIGNPDAIRGVDESSAGGPARGGSVHRTSGSTWGGSANPAKAATTRNATQTTDVSLQGGRASTSNPTLPQADQSFETPFSSLAESSTGGTVQSFVARTSAETAGASSPGGGASFAIIVIGGATTSIPSASNGGVGSTSTGGTTTVVANGAAGAINTTSTGPVAVCAPDERRCVGKSLRRCNSFGQWDEPSPCAFVCDPQAAQCTGVCTPESAHCSSKTIETCSALGQWIPGQTCPNICTAGECTGSCSPGAQNCSDAIRQTCNLQGAWDDVEICPNICKLDNGVAQCSGVCRPGTFKCLNNRTLQTCGADGTWGSTAACTYACVGNSCGGSCVPGTKTCDGSVLRSCLDSGALDAGKECDFVCQGTACTGVCRPPSVQCDRNTPQHCTTSGVWENGTACGSGQICRSGACETNTPYNLGQSSRLANASPASAGNYLFATPINVVRRAAVLKFGMVAGAAGANVKFGLYTDGGGSPGARVAQSDPVALASGSVETPSAVAYTVTPGIYWVVAVYSANASDFNQQGVAGTRVYYAPHPYTQALPAAFPSGTALEGYQFNYYINVQDVP